MTQKIKVRPMKLLSLTLLAIVPIMSFSKGKNEYLFYLDNYLLNNSSGLRSLTGNRTYVHVANTFGQKIGGKYSRILNRGILFSGGVEFGYEKYSAKIYFPFYEFGFFPYGPPDKYELRATIPYAQVDLNIGYRYGRLKKVQPEIRIGHIIRAPLKSKQFRYDSFEPSVYGFYDINFSVNGYYGQPLPNGLGLEMIEYLSAGVNLLSKVKGVNQFYLGIQYQKQLIFTDNPFNYFRIEYNDVVKLKSEQDEFIGLHSAYGIVLGLVF